MGDSAEQPKGQEDEEISFDFSKVKGFFSKMKEKAASPKETTDKSAYGKHQKIHHDSNIAGQQDDESVAIDPATFTKAKKLFANHWKLLLVLIPIIVTLYVRDQAPALTITDEWARNSANNYYQNQIANQIRQQYPNLPDNNLKPLIEKQFKDFLSQNKENVNAQAKELSQGYKEYFRYESGSSKYTYIGDIDSYYWLRFARNVVDKGTVCDAVEDGICYDTYTLAPLKRRMFPNIHPYAIAWFYKIVKVFRPDFTLMQAEIRVPTLYAVIVAILVFLMMLRAFGPLAALFSSVLISVSPIFLTRSLGSDTDVYNVFFPVLIIFFLFEAFNAETTKKKAIFSTLTGISMGVYSLAWVGWWYLFDFGVIAIVGDFGLKAAKAWRKDPSFKLGLFLKGDAGKHMLALLIPLVVSAFLAVGMISGFSSLKVIYEEPFAFTKAKAASNRNLFPNVKTTVAEFNEASINVIIGQMGGKWIFFFTLFGIIILIYRDMKTIFRHPVSFFLSALAVFILVSYLQNINPILFLGIFAIPFLIGVYFSFNSEQEQDIKLPILFFLWIASSIYASTKGVRFTLLLVPPIAIGIGITIGFFHEILTNIIKSTFKLNKTLVFGLLFILLSYPLVAHVKSGINVGKGYLPSVNDQWWDTLTKIKDNSKPDAIINSWWDFGHWFKYIADRRVTLDGSSQNNPPLHWLGKILLTSNEREAVGMLRMVDCGSNNAFLEINKKINHTPSSIKILNKILVLGPEDAKKTLLENNFSGEEADAILKASHCEAPENFFITSEDMIGKGGVWAHFGSWNFDRSWLESAYRNSRNELEFSEGVSKYYNYTPETISSYYSEIKNLKGDRAINEWIAPWPSFMAGEQKCRNQSSLVTCEFQNLKIDVNLTTMDATLQTPQGTKRFNRFSWTTPDGLATKRYREDTIGAGMLLLITSDGYYSLIMAPELVNSMFTRLFYLNGHGIRYFDRFDDSQGFSNFQIRVWKVSWKGNKQPIIVPRYNVTNPYFEGENVAVV
ncbi:hypothetical protein HYV84_04150 [Candidatus Woesearchaeota archaeon]|nr:hypothetical protein [Candidatus Woesearchaeota archaeon]